MSNVKKGVYILPNLFTSANLLFGFYAIIHAIKVTLNGQFSYHTSAKFILLAALFDLIDGRVARKTNTASRFGIEYDSLCDLVSFGVAPALTMYLWTLQGMGKAGWLICFLYVACAALRLARFNVQAVSVESKHFQGLPVPMAALTLCGILMLWKDKEISTLSVPIFGTVEAQVAILMTATAILMVSNVPYRNTKSLSLTRRLPFYYLVFVIAGFMLWAYKPLWIMFILGVAYIMSGPLEFVVRWVFNKPIAQPLPKQKTSDSPKDIHYLRPKL
jgi:CDP-diacylglycerol--serine O-phosphatidyltransferase